MAYNEEKLARLKHLKQLAQKAKAESDAVATRVKALEDAGAQANVLETIKVNGVVQKITGGQIRMAYLVFAGVALVNVLLVLMVNEHKYNRDWMAAHKK